MYKWALAFKYLLGLPDTVCCAFGNQTSKAYVICVYGYIYSHWLMEGLMPVKIPSSNIFASS